MGRLIKLDQWETDEVRCVVLGDRETGGQSYAEALFIPKPGCTIAIPPDVRAQCVAAVTQWANRSVA